MVQAAIRKGMTEIGFAEHFPYPPEFRIDVPDCVVPSGMWDGYLAEVREAGVRYRDRIRIRLGAEIDYLPGHESYTAAGLAKHAYDVVFGSVHLLDGIVIDYDADYLEARIDALGGTAGLWRRYWDTLEALIRSRLCDVIAHLDLPKKLGLGFPGSVDWERVADILDRIREHNLTIELNTGGVDRAVMHEPYPDDRILRMAFEKGIDVVIGSDAHHPGQIARHFEDALQRLESIGWRYLSVFQGRKKSCLPISHLR